MTLTPQDIKYASDHRARIAMRLWLVTLVGLFASWKWLVIIFSCFAIVELINMHRVLKIPNEDNEKSDPAEEGRAWGKAIVCAVSAYIPVFILGSGLKLLKDFVLSFFS